MFRDKAPLKHRVPSIDEILKYRMSHIRGSLFMTRHKFVLYVQPRARMRQSDYRRSLKVPHINGYIWISRSRPRLIPCLTIAMALLLRKSDRRARNASHGVAQSTRRVIIKIFQDFLRSQL